MANRKVESILFYYTLLNIVIKFWLFFAWNVYNMDSTFFLESQKWLY